MTRHPFLFVFFWALLFASSLNAQSFTAGVFLEQKSANPSQGVGFRVEKRMIERAFFSANVRVQALRFSEEIDVLDYSGEFVPDTHREVEGSVSAIAYVSIPGIKLDPFAGFGIGFNRNMRPDRSEFLPRDVVVSSILYSAVGGVRFDFVPFVKPFAEYRVFYFTNADPAVSRAKYSVIAGFSVGF